MSIVSTTAAIETALKTVPVLSVYTEPSANPNLPACFIGPPLLNWTVFNGVGPDQGTFRLYVAVADNGYAVATLEPMLDLIAAALDPLNGALTGAVPSSWPLAGANIPAYQLTWEASLS